ncbi:hypothetical protein AMAG_12740 [Allomyces macrogynus ATCC 38327]|uniref:MTHFR SAM-binding regulatory domain-containing protein n=1 Tax=Allomyces macrogynus (strain ATCC 38327) TaxID=578462 RepID=A0A0L0T1R8_ALLM3|nr:hypothetical protein AMAG_12740 [Allomyces macrogynus ATCC 38327]|eukprot:KNE68570.1 hypothetical protein AMAG_12740 [Allomyces macrogynus ATCC 38327]
MKVIDKLRRAHEQGRQAWSFEYFPPKTQQGVLNLYDRLERMYALAPEFIDVTWGAGGTTADLTMDICHVAQAVYGLETCMHLTCTNMPRDKIDAALKQARDIGIQNILALRGDPPRGQAEWTACDNGFAYAVDLVKYIREVHGDWFCIGVAGYPEGHLENPDKEADLRHLKAKIDAGADYIVTQMFYDVDLFLNWVRRCRAIVCRGKISALPWSDQPLAPESRTIASLLAQLNARGCLTINSQPPVNGAPSTDAVHGWGPRGGYVYQKAYLEVFVSPQVLDALANRLATTPDAEFVSFHAINRAGDLRTNEADPNSPNAVTWGVFPGKEIVQPTIVDLTSFMAWKDEAFELWTQWRNVYPASSPAYTNIDRVASDWYLVTIVHNDFHQPESVLVNLLLAAAADVDGVPVEKTPSIVEDLLASEPASVPEVASSTPSSPPAANGIKKSASGAPAETAVAPAIEPASRPATAASKATTNGVATKLSTVSACSPAAPAVTAVSS